MVHLIIWIAVFLIVVSDSNLAFAFVRYVPTPAILSNAYLGEKTTECSQGLPIATLSFFLAEKLPSVIMTGVESRYFLRINGHPPSARSPRRDG